MEKLKLHSLDITQENIAKLAELFPNCITESTDEKGAIKRSIDFDQLRQELSTAIVEGPQERYQINWPGKKQALVDASSPVSKTLRPNREESINFDTTKNIFIEGDNLEVMKLLQESYLGKIKIIYTDPPYNTGKDFIYNDDYAENHRDFSLKSNQTNASGERLIANLESNGRFHSVWLSMMYARLRLARNLMRDDGIIFMSIDNNEVHNLKKICDEIFGSGNFVEQFIVRSNPRGNQAKKFVASEHEYILCYSKNVLHMSLLGFSKEEGQFNKEDGGGIYREIGLRKRGAGSRREDAPNQFYPIYYLESEKKITTKKIAGAVEIIPRLSDGSDGRWRWAHSTVDENSSKLLARKVRRDTGNEYDIFERDYFSEDKLSKIKSIFYEKDVNNENGTEELKKLFGKKVFDYPKPVFTIKKLIQCVNDDSALILDFFAGSGTSAHAVMQLNAEDGGKRSFILVQIPESCNEESEAFKAGYKTISEIGKERIRRAGQKIKTENALTTPDLDIGFRVLKIDSPNMKEVFYTPGAVAQDLLSDQVNNIREDRTPEDLLFQVLLDWGVDLTLPIAQETIADKTVYFVDGNALAACFDEGVDEEFVKLLAKREPLRVVFRDAGFASDSVKINVEQIFKLISSTTEVKTI